MFPIKDKQDLTIYSFFTNFISDPLSSKLNQTHKVIALIASIILAPLTLGILHCATCIWRQRRIEAYKQKDIYSGGKLASLIQRIAACPEVIKLSSSSNIGSSLTRETLARHIQSELIDPCYAKPLPSLDSVTVPVEIPLPGGETKIEWKQWKDLSREEKVRVNNSGTLPHNQLYGPFAPYIVDFAFSPPFCSSNIPKDPRMIHGSDHAIRASLFSTVFAFLYQKYHPDYQVTEKDILLAQFVAAGHDCERQTEGPDVYDQRSAETTKKALQKLGVTDQSDLEVCYQAIAKKDDPNLGTKSLIAKCVQNADSMDFSRIWFQDSIQDPGEFEKARGFLDIYKEFQGFQDRGQALKEGYSFEEFQTELDALRIEMNRFIAATIRQKARTKASEGGNYYESVLQHITPYSFPLLYAVFQKTTVLPQECEESQDSDIVEEGESWADHGIEKSSTPFLQRFLHKIQSVSSVSEKQRLAEIQAKIETELQVRTTALERYSKAKEQSGGTAQVIQAYAMLPPILQDENPLPDDLPVSSLDGSSLAFRFVELKKQILLLNDLIKHQPQDPARLFAMAQLASSLYNEYPREYRDERHQTTIAIALQQAAHTYYTQNNTAKLEEIVHFAEEQLTPNSRLEDVLKDSSPQVHMVEIGTSDIRKQKLRIERKKIDEKDFVEISFEVTAASRSNLFTQTTSPLYRACHVPSHFERRNESHTFSSSGTDLPLFCKDLCITPLDSDSISVYVGNTPLFWNQYHLVRLRFPPTTPLKQVQKLLCRIGLMTAFMPQRQEDVHHCSLARILAMRFPKIVYAIFPKRDPQDIYDTLLSPAQKETVDEDLRQLRLGFTGEEVEMVHPALVQEIREKGGRSLAIGMSVGSMKSTAKVLANIFRCGFLSSQERAQRGVLGHGTVSVLNNFAGSANQVFSRILTHNLFQESCDLSRFFMPGQVFVLLDVQAFERIPYAYHEDLSGVRNPHYFFPIWPAPGNEDILLPFIGRTVLQWREELPEFVNMLNSHLHLNNECMFDRSLGSKYIRKILVSSEQDRTILLDTLYRNNVRFSHGRRVEDMVVVSQTLTPALEEEVSAPTGEGALYDSRNCSAS